MKARGAGQKAPTVSEGLHIAMTIQSLHHSFVLTRCRVGMVAEAGRNKLYAINLWALLGPTDSSAFVLGPLSSL